MSKTVTSQITVCYTYIYDSKYHKKQLEDVDIVSVSEQKNRLGKWVLEICYFDVEVLMVVVIRGERGRGRGRQGEREKKVQEKRGCGRKKQKIMSQITRVGFFQEGSPLCTCLQKFVVTKSIQK